MRITEMKLGVANAFDALLRVKDEFSCEHAARVATQANKIAEAMGISEVDRTDLTLAAALHRLGHFGTPDEMLWKTGTLTADDRIAYQGYSERGARILAMVPELRNVADLVQFHHENFDGSGFPRGLEGEQIPLACRIIRVADEYNLLTHPRALSVSVSHEDALRSIEARVGIEFDPAVVKVMAQLEPSVPGRLRSQTPLDEEWMVDAPGEFRADLLAAPSW
jgi:HD-GYP domain-containing protein (c-di-GMP phosphodiesterase class II)